MNNYLTKLKIFNKLEIKRLIYISQIVSRFVLRILKIKSVNFSCFNNN
jgi:hypothetical protein